MCIKSVSSKIISQGIKVRSAFDIGDRKLANWFPGHMATGLRKMQKRLTDVDCIVEVHDARIPLSGRNPAFEKTLLGIKPYIFILNKMDLIDMKDSQRVIDHYKSLGVQNILFTNCKDQTDKAIKNFVPMVSDLIMKSNRFNRAEENAFEVMIIGIPNVGKSSFINALRAINTRKGKGTAVGKLPGMTRSVLEKIKIHLNPPIYMLDTPGVLPPVINDVETGLKLALVNTTKNHLVGEDVIADYLLYRLNLIENYQYVDFLGLDEPTDDIQSLLCQAAIKNGYIKKVKFHDGMRSLPDIFLTAYKFIAAYRAGQFGYLELDKLR